MGRKEEERERGWEVCHRYLPFSRAAFFISGLAQLDLGCGTGCAVTVDDALSALPSSGLDELREGR